MAFKDSYAAGSSEASSASNGSGAGLATTLSPTLPDASAAPEVSLDSLRAAQSRTAKSTGYRQLFKNKRFLALWLAQVFSQLADRVIFVVFIALIAAQFGASDRLNSYLYIAFTIPAMLLTAIAGVFVDRLPIRPLLIVTSLLRAMLVLALPLSLNAGLWAFYGLAFGVSAVTQFFVPAESSAIPAVVPKSQLIAANSLFMTTMMASVIFGFALGDPLIAVFGLGRVHWAIGGLFLLSACILVGIGKLPAAHAKDAERPFVALKHVFEDLFDGLRFVASKPLIWQSILKLAVLFSIVVALCILLVPYTRAYLFPDPAIASRKFAYIVAVSGLGMALGAVLVGRLFKTRKALRPRLVMAYIGLGIIGAGLLMMAMITPVTNMIVEVVPSLETERARVMLRFAYTYACALVMGISAAFVAIPVQALLHERIPADKRGKVMGVQFTVLSTCSTLPVLLAGVGVEWIGIVWMLILMGLPLFSIAAYNLSLYAWSRLLRRA
ncbi:MAG: MFS transporter [Vampirovibrionales bacterium]|nr:MFS transporter [Vampirovibrionales bacterium]